MQEEKTPTEGNKWIKLLIMKGRFGLSSIVATLADYLIYGLLSEVYVGKTAATAISRFVGMLINFILQKKFVFQLNRPLGHTLAYSLIISLIGIALGAGILYVIGDWEIWGGNKYYPKFVETGLVFFFNFYLKRFAFEKVFLD